MQVPDDSSQDQGQGQVERVGMEEKENGQRGTDLHKGQHHDAGSFPLPGGRVGWKMGRVVVLP